jgi:hypothetical protein
VHGDAAGTGGWLHAVAAFTAVDTSRVAAIRVLADLPAEELDELAAAMRETTKEPGAKVVTLDDCDLLH